MFVSSSVTAFALFAAIASMPVPASTGVKAVPQASVQSVSASGQFATLRGVTAVPMASRELDAVKGAHFHFATPSQNTQNFGVTGLHLVNKNNTDAWVDLGNGQLVGPGYHGLCGAALNSPKMFIPGQSEATGIGGGC